MKQTHDIKLAESLSPTTKTLEDFIKSINESTKQLVKKSDIVDENTQTPATEIITGTQSLRDTLTLMKKSKTFFKLQENPDGKIFRNKIPIIPQGENRVSFKSEEFDIKPNFQNYFTITRLTTKRMHNEDKLIIFNILKNNGFYDNNTKIGMKFTGMQVALYNLPKELVEIQNPPLPAIENDLQGEGVKIIIPSNITDTYTRLEVLLALRLSGHTDTLTEASNLIDETYKRGEIQKKQHYRNALNKFQT